VVRPAPAARPLRPSGDQAVAAAESADDARNRKGWGRPKNAGGVEAGDLEMQPPPRGLSRW
jgi:hypothetical protein